MSIYVLNRDLGYKEFKCPVCGWHSLPTIKVEGRPCWEYNGDPTCPTFGPSIKSTLNGKGSGHNPDWEFTINGRKYNTLICHFYIRNGFFEFCHDSNHELAGHTIPMIPYTETELIVAGQAK